jgi:hypothetical protein
VLVISLFLDKTAVKAKPAVKTMAFLDDMIRLEESNKIKEPSSKSVLTAIFKSFSYESASELPPPTSDAFSFEEKDSNLTTASVESVYEDSPPSSVTVKDPQKGWSNCFILICSVHFY